MLFVALTVFPTAAAGSALATHRPQSNPRLTGRVNILEDSGVVGAEITTRERLVRAHGILMIIAWPVLAVTAIFFAAWMKPALPNGEWFQVTSHSLTHTPPAVTVQREIEFTCSEYLLLFCRSTEHS